MEILWKLTKILKQIKKWPNWIFQVKMGTNLVWIHQLCICTHFHLKNSVWPFFNFFTWKYFQNDTTYQIFTNFYLRGPGENDPFVSGQIFLQFTSHGGSKNRPIQKFSWYTCRPDIRWDFKKKFLKKFLFLQKLWLFAWF